MFTTITSRAGARLRRLDPRPATRRARHRGERPRRNVDAVDDDRHLGGGLHRHARQPRRHDGAAVDPPRPARVDPEPRMDGERLHAHVRRAAADRRRARRPLRPPADVRARARDLPGRLGRRRARPVDRLADRGARVPGHRRRDRRAADADDPLRGGARASGAAPRSASGARSAASPSASGRSSAAPIVQSISWQWIFWLNVPIGARADPVRDRAGSRSRTDRTAALDLPGLGLASTGLFGIVSA